MTVFSPEIFIDRGAWWATVHRVNKVSDTTEQLMLSDTLSKNIYRRQERI